MDKPLSLIVQDVEKEIVEVINKSQLPAFILKIILEKLYKQVEMLEQEEIEKYEEKLKKGKEGDNNGN